jgi:hypothetical protein
MPMLVNNIRSCSMVFPLVGRRRKFMGAYWAGAVLSLLEIVDVRGKFAGQSS